MSVCALHIAVVSVLMRQFILQLSQCSCTISYYSCLSAHAPVYIAVVSVLMHQFILQLSQCSCTSSYCSCLSAHAPIHITSSWFKLPYSSLFSPCKLSILFHKPTFRLCVWLSCMQEEIKITLNLVNACYHSVQNLLFAQYLSKIKRMKNPGL